MLAAAAVWLAACGGGGDTSVTATVPAATEAAAVTESASTVAVDVELTGITGWLNSERLTIAGEIAEGRVVLIDFWTYTCVNCIRTLPFIKAWHERYAEHGLTIIGVHSPEFDFEHSTANVAEAIATRGIEYAVAQDSDFATWRAFDNRFWPAKYLFGGDGEIAYSHFGEGSYEETELAIRRALQAAGHDLSAVEPTAPEPPGLDPTATRQTAELYGGYQRNYTTHGRYAGQPEYYLGPDEVRLYEDDGTRTDSQWYLEGLWLNTSEAIVHARMTEDLSDYLALRFEARSVNVVLSSAGGEPYDVVVEIDGRPLTAEEAGADIAFDDEGRSILRYDGPRMFGLVELPAHGVHELVLRTDSEDFAMHAFTFGSYTEGA
jgi:thiol-disulfide isomerase/thioredoxin